MTDSYLDATKIISELGLIRLELANLRKEVAKLQERQAPVYHVGPTYPPHPQMSPQYPWPWVFTTCSVTPPSRDDQRTSAVEKFMADYAAKSKAAE